MKKQLTVCPGWSEKTHSPDNTNHRKQFTKILSWGNGSPSHGMCNECRKEFDHILKKSNKQK